MSKFAPFYEPPQQPKPALVVTIPEFELIRLREIEKTAKLAANSFNQKEKCQFNPSACPDCTWLKVCDSMPKLARLVLDVKS
jgi:radical SAM protein with 4Fe4S-binding SPASM domain